MTNGAADNEDIRQLEGTYAPIRGQVEYEAQLYNQRIVWFITMEAFLFATVGLLVQAVIQTNATVWMNQINGLLMILCALGSVVALITNRILGNAREALASKILCGRLGSSRLRPVWEVAARRRRDTDATDQSGQRGDAFEMIPRARRTPT